MGKVSLTFNEAECMGCRAFEVACKQEHGPGVGPSVAGAIERTPFFRPLYCHHCDDASCVMACPEQAMTADPVTGAVLHDNGKCTGCHAVAGKSGAEKQETSSCKIGCPGHINIQACVSLAGKGRYEEALQLIKEACPFPSICGRVCPHPCESNCERSQIDKPVAIHSVERLIADLDLNRGKRYRPEINEKREDKIAIIGSGPAGLSCAYYLAVKGYPVTVLERAPVLGGMLATGIPSYRLPRGVVEAEIQFVRDMGVTMRTGLEVGKDKKICQLRMEGFRAIFIAIGAQECLRLDVAGEDLKGVYSGVDYLRQVSLGNPLRLGRDVAVIGGGNVATGAARTARRLGSENAFILYPGSLEEMPSRPEEIEACQEEGIPIHLLAQPVRLLGENGTVKAVECVRTKLTEPDGSGRRTPVPVPGSEFTIPVDAVINALGRKSDWACLTLECACRLTGWGTINVDPLTLQSDDPDIFAGGDAVRGPASVIEAIADGREAALSIDRFIKGQDLRLGREAVLKAIKEPQKEKYDPAPRATMPCLKPQDRLKNFKEVELGLTKEAAAQEARRCISCGSCCIQACPYGVIQFNQAATKAIKYDICVEKRGRNEIPVCLASARRGVSHGAI